MSDTDPSASKSAHDHVERDRFNFELNRREFLVSAMAVGVSAGLPGIARAQAAGTDTPVATRPKATEIAKLDLNLKINGQARKLKIDPRTTLLDLLREDLHLTGTKKGCDHGQCGACTVIVDGQRINSCLSLAAQNEGAEVLTIEGLAQGEQLHPMQAAFIEHDAYQCGFCTPGQIMSAVALMNEPCGDSEAEVRECMSGNICRCGAYRNILDAIGDVRGKKHGTV